MRLPFAISAGVHLGLSVLFFGWIHFSPPLLLPVESYTVSLVELPAPEPAEVEPVEEPTPEPVEEPIEQIEPEEEPIEEEPEIEEAAVEEPEPTPEPPEPEPEPSPEPARDRGHKVPAEPNEEETRPRKPREESLSGSLAIDAKNFPYSYYLNQIRRKIKSRWKPIPPGNVVDPQVCVVYFRILRNGRVEDVRIEGETGHALYDRAGLRAVLNAAPFPPLPPGFRGDDLGVHFSFEYVP